MKLSITNLAKIQQADIELNGLTVIAGDNDTGKSTIGKTLYAMFNGFKDLSRVVHIQRCQSLAAAVINEVAGDGAFPAGKTSILGSYKEIDELAQVFEQEQDLSVDIVLNDAKKYILDRYDFDILDKDEHENGIAQKLRVIMSVTDDEISRQWVENIYKRVFQSQINSLQTDDFSDVNMQIKRQNVSVLFKNNSCLKAEIGFNLIHSAVYIDNPFVLDKVSSKFSSFESDMSDELVRRLRRQKKIDTVTNIVNDKALRDVIDIIENTVPGEFTWLNRQLLLQRAEWKEPLNIKNLSAGVKSFAILKLLIQNHQLKERDVLILDEPEIHLHPAWQLKYAEFLVLFQKVFDLTILLTTHSPYFLNAIEVYSRKYKSIEKVRIYKTEITDNNRIRMIDVTDNPESIYEKMAKPIIEMRQLRNEIDEGNL